jgi:hypothetical protein
VLYVIDTEAAVCIHQIHVPVLGHYWAMGYARWPTQEGTFGHCISRCPSDIRDVHIPAKAIVLLVDGMNFHPWHIPPRQQASEVSGATGVGVDAQHLDADAGSKCSAGV